MNILKLFEAGKPVISHHEEPHVQLDRRTLTDRIHALGAGQALEEVLADPRKLLYRGVRAVASSIFSQDTLASTRLSENTSNYATLFTEILPSWKRANLLPRSKIVSCTSSLDHAFEYGPAFVALPTDGAQCAYTGVIDFWNAFEGINHVYGGPDSLPAINSAVGREATRIIATGAELQQFCNELEEELDSGKKKIEQLNPDLQTLLQSDENTHNILEILDNLMDPSHMRISSNGHLLVPGANEEVSVGGNIVFIKRQLFADVFKIGSGE